MRIYFTISLMLLFSTIMFGQQRTVTGKVTSSEDGQPLPGVSVVVTGTSAGTITDFDGKYQLNVAEGATSLTFTFIGMTAQDVQLTGASVYDVVLEPTTIGVDEVVVTALGIEKKSRGLTYSTQQVKSDELTRAKDVNMINSVAGKSAGVVVSRGANGIGSSSKVVLRGDKSISGNNQVLYVIDGIPMNNANGSQASTLYDAYDGGDAISNLNPDDIESMNILKGASAAALYGSQAANGVILINTKKGKNGVLSVDFVTNTTFESVLSTPELQTDYVGRWGAKQSGISDNHVSDFFQTGYATINSVSVSKGSENNQFYLSYANTKGEGVIGGNELMKNNINFRGTSKLTEKLSVDANVNIIDQDVQNRPFAGYYFNPLVGLYLFPIGDDFNKYKNFEVYNNDRELMLQNWDYPMALGGISFQNPYWVTNRNLNENVRNRILATFSGNYEITKDIKLKVRYNYDKTSDNYEQKIYAGTDAVISNPKGEYTVSSNTNFQKYGDLLLMINKDLNEKLNLDFTLGASTTSTVNSGERISSFSDHMGNQYNHGLYYANFFSLENINGKKDFSKYQYEQEVLSNALFGNVQVGYNQMVFVDFSGRQEWTSTTSKPFFYPQAGLSFILSEAIGKSDVFSYGKLRLSYADVGNALPFGVSEKGLRYYVGPGGYLIPNTTIAHPNKELVPERTKSFEIGGDFRFLDNSISVDLSYYNAKSIDQVFRISATGGEAANYWVNGGEIRNSGIEASVGYHLRAENGFRWDPVVNFSKNTNEVLSLSKELANPWVVITSMDQTKIYELRVTEGGSYGDIYGKKYALDANGNALKDKDGAPVATEDLELLGNVAPDFMLSMSNGFSFKGFSLNVLVDGRFGGDVVSMTEAYLDESGLSQRSADARNAGDFTFKGTSFDPKVFYEATGGSGGITEAYMFDATNIRVRELSFGYSFTKGLFNNHIKGIDFSIVARNIGFIYKKAPFDPELTLSAGNGLQGLDAFSMPSTKSVGFNIKVKF